MFANARMQRVYFEIVRVRLATITLRAHIYFAIVLIVFNIHSPLQYRSNALSSRPSYLQMLIRLTRTYTQ